MAKKIQDSGSAETLANDESYLTSSIIGDGDTTMAVIAPPAIMPSKKGNQKPQSPLDEEMGENYELHFGTTAIDNHGGAHRDPTVKLLILGVACLIVVLLGM